MNNFPTFAQIRAERAARELRGVVLPFQPPVQHEIAAENALAATWSEFAGMLIDLWAGTCLDFMHNIVIWDRIEIVDQQTEADHNGRLLADLFEEA